MASPPDNASRVYRIVSKRYPPFDGSGAYRFGSRWVSPGRQVVHTAESYALAVLENLVHWRTSSPPKGLVYVAADIPDELEQEELPRRSMPRSDSNDYARYRAIGDEWFDRGESVALWVPSVISPHEHNVLINQNHPDFAKLKVRKAAPAQIDPRLAGPSK
ncbi:MAG: RES domain-containing protein [Pseudomonadota bacterium]